MKKRAMTLCQPEMRQIEAAHEVSPMVTVVPLLYQYLGHGHRLGKIRSRSTSGGPYRV